MTVKYTKSFPMFTRLVKTAQVTPVELFEMYRKAGYSVAYGTVWNWHSKARGDTDIGLGLPKWVEREARVLWEAERDRQKRQAVLNLNPEAAEIQPEEAPPTKLATELEKWAKTAGTPAVVETSTPTLRTSVQTKPTPEPASGGTLTGHKLLELPVEAYIDDAYSQRGEIKLVAPQGRRLSLDDIVPMIQKLTGGKVRNITIEY